MITDHSSYNNDWYKKEIGASRLKQILWYFVNVIFLINPLNPSSGLRIFLLRIFGATIKEDVVIKPGVNIKYPWKLVIGSHCWIGERVWIDNLAPVTLGKNVCISQGAMLLTGNHNFTKVSFDLIIAPICLEDGVWVGARSIVCPGVTAGSHAVLTVNSTATKDLERYGVYRGNPAEKIKQRIIE